ncbi:MAG: calcium/sodium antiporter [Prevotella sp.]|nr:calcium/sodium antiporter [Prevotella sp.]MDY6229749.1 calcium/sodium antiporter [Prevotella sp.]
MIFDIILIIVGIVAVLYGADRMTEGAVALAKRIHIPEIVIGLTIVAIGTSAPELFVSTVSALNGTPDLAVGNVVGSNTFNTLLIAGAAAAVAPIDISRITVKRDLPLAALSSLLLIVLCLDSDISRTDALMLFAGFIIFMVITVMPAIKDHKDSEQPTAEAAKTDSETAKAPYSVTKAVGLIILGLALLVAGSNIFVDNASQLAVALGVSQAVVGLTIVAGGTSLPELATSVVAARKGQSAIAIGNVLGSNIFNILMILGITGIIQPMKIEGITIIDLATMLISIILLWLFSFTKLKVQRWEGIVLLMIFAAYMAWLLH